MKRDNVIASVALGKELKDKLERLAKLEHISLSKMFKISIAYYLGFSNDFKDRVERLAKDLGVLPPFVIERLALAHLAEMAADEELTGGVTPRALLEFTPGLPAQQFYDYWKSTLTRSIK